MTFVEVGMGGWDTHQDNFERSRTLSAQARLFLERFEAEVAHIQAIWDKAIKKPRRR